MFIRGRNLIIGLVLTILLSSGLTVLALGFGEDPLAGSGASASNDADFAKLKDAYQTLREDYFQEVNSDSLLNGAINGMIKSLDDPYSTYMDPTEAASFHENISSSFEGIGAEIKEEDGRIVVDVPIKGAPAEKAGVKPKDIILKVNDTSLEGMKVTEAVKHIRGEKGSKAELLIQRPGTEGTLTIPVIRDTIPLETVTYEMMPDNMGKIVISQFSENTDKEFKTALEDLKTQGMKGLVIDLRQNPGGLLDVAVEIGNTLIPKGKLILQVEHRDGSKKQYSSTGGKPDFPVVVLGDGGSASAAEILIGALKESAKTPVVGDKSFGKGTVQTTHSYKDGSNIKYTTAKWLTPDGNWVHKKGIEPDYKVSMPEYAGLPYLDPAKELKLDLFGTEVKTLQGYLEGLGYNPGRKDGFFDTTTREAVISFQKIEGLEATGVVSGKTTNRMIELLRERVQKNDTQLDMAKQVLRKMLP